MDKNLTNVGKICRKLIRNNKKKLKYAWKSYKNMRKIVKNHENSGKSLPKMDEKCVWKLGEIGPKIWKKNR